MLCQTQASMERTKAWGGEKQRIDVTKFKYNIHYYLVQF